MNKYHVLENKLKYTGKAAILAVILDLAYSSSFLIVFVQISPVYRLGIEIDFIISEDLELNDIRNMPIWFSFSI